MQQTDEHNDDEKYAQISTRRPLLRIPFAEACAAPPSTKRGNTMTALPLQSDRCFACDVKRSCRRSIDSFVRSCPEGGGGLCFGEGLSGGVSREGVNVAEGV